MITVAVFLLCGGIVFATARKFSLAGICFAGFLITCAVNIMVSLVN